MNKKAKEEIYKSNLQFFKDLTKATKKTTKGKILAYNTKYRLKTKDGYKTYGTYIIAKNKKDLLKKIKLRGLNEQVIGYHYKETPPSLLKKISLMTKEEILDKKLTVIHQISFISFLLCRSKLSKLTNPVHLISDLGFIHDSIHYLDELYNSPTPDRKIVTFSDFIKTIKKLEKLAIKIGVYN